MRQASCDVPWAAMSACRDLLRHFRKRVSSLLDRSELLVKNRLAAVRIITWIPNTITAHRPCMPDQNILAEYCAMDENRVWVPTNQILRRVVVALPVGLFFAHYATTSPLILSNAAVKSASVCR